MKGSKAPVYVVKPKNIFKHPFNKFDLEKPSIRQTQNEDLTDYFNYGFNEDTMNIYGKLVKRAIETLDEGINPTYFDQPSQLMRLNDQIPMDFGGFCKFFDNSVFVGSGDDEENSLTNMENFHTGDELFNFFIYQIFVNKSQYPLIDFVKSLYQAPDEKESDGAACLYEIKAQIERNLEAQYQRIMVKLEDKKNNIQNVVPPHKSKQRSKQGSQKNQSNSESAESQSSQSQSQQSSSSEKDHRTKRKQRSRQKSRKQKRSHRESSRKDHRRRESSRQHKSRKSKSHRYRQSDRDRDRDRDKRRKERSRDKHRDKKKRRH